MTNPDNTPTGTQSPVPRTKTAILSMNAQSRDVDRCFQLLANRRRRICRYHLSLATEPLSIRELAGAVEASLAPPEATITDRILEEAVRRLVHTHLPKLREAGLVRVTDEHVELAPYPALPIRDWLADSAMTELDAAGRVGQSRERRVNEDSHDGRLTRSERGLDSLPPRIGSTQ